MKKKTVALLLALTLVLGVVAGGTIAWLTAQTTPVVNTFTTSDIKVKLEETGTTNNAKSYQMVPGYTLSKDPKVTVEAGSEKCYVFVKATPSAEKYTVDREEYTISNFLTYSIKTSGDGAWTALDGVDGVYYMIVDKSERNQTFEILDGNKVTVPQTVTKEMMNAVGENYPTLTFKAAAVQYNNSNDGHFEPAVAYDQVKTDLNP